VLWVLKIGREARDRFGITVCVGVASMLLPQVSVNLGTVTPVLECAHRHAGAGPRDERVGALIRVLRASRANTQRTRLP